MPLLRPQSGFVTNRFVWTLNLQTALIDELPIAYRLALSYAPFRTKPVTLVLLSLDAKLGRIMANSQEPILVQIRFAWWRDELRKLPKDRLSGDPLLDLIGQCWAGSEAGLIAMVDGWEELLTEAPMPAVSVKNFAAGRAAAFVGLAELVGAGSTIEDTTIAARYWAMADLQFRISDDAERETVRAQIDDLQDQQNGKLPRSMRPLAVLHGLARRSIETGEAEPVGSRYSILAAMRLGILGR